MDEYVRVPTRKLLELVVESRLGRDLVGKSPDERRAMVKKFTDIFEGYLKLRNDGIRQDVAQVLTVLAHRQQRKRDAEFAGLMNKLSRMERASM